MVDYRQTDRVRRQSHGAAVARQGRASARMVLAAWVLLAMAVLLCAARAQSTVPAPATGNARQGVIAPPAQIDPAIRVPAPSASATPMEVIPPLAVPGNKPDVQAK